MKEEKVGQEKEELELIDFDIDDITDETIENEIIDIPQETNNTLTEVIDIPEVKPETPVQETPKTESNVISNTEKFVENMQNFVSAITEPTPVEKTSTFKEIFSEMGKVKTTKEKIKIFLKEKRSRALAGLMFWIIFMTVAVVIIKTNMGINEDPVEPVDPSQNSVEMLSSMNNYDYTVVLINSKDTKILAGSYFQNRTLFIYNDVQMYEENNIYSRINNGILETTELNLEIDMKKVSPYSLARILTDSKVIETLTDNNNKVIGRSYEISARKLVEYLCNEQINSDKNIKISVKYEENQINYIDINMSEIEALLPENKAISAINVSYRRIGKVTMKDVTYDNRNVDEGPNEYYNGDSESELEGE